MTNKYTAHTLALMAVLAGCTPKSTGGDVADDIGDTGGADTTGGTDGCGQPTDTGEEPPVACVSPFVGSEPTPAMEPLPIASNEVYALPIGGSLRYIVREGATTTVLIFAGMGGQWPSASAYLQGLDLERVLPTANLAVVELVNPYGLAHDYVSIDPALFTPGPGESPYVTWGWWPWNQGDDPNDPNVPGAYPVLVQTGDAIEAIVGDVDYFVQLGKEAGSRSYGCGVGNPYDCNGHTVMAFGGAESFAFAEDVASILAALEPAWAPWDLDHPIGIIYDDPVEGEDRWLGTAAQWAHVTWGAATIEVILPVNLPADDCAPLLPGEKAPTLWPADGKYRWRSHVERAATVAAALDAVALAVQ